jgi:hypothetical protein
MLGSHTTTRSRRLRIFLAALALATAALLALALSACGGAEKTVATVGQSKISQATLSHWMTTQLGSDYQGAVGKQAPLGLVSDPPDYAGCLSVARRVVPSLNGHPQLSDSQLRQKCRQLNTAVREQALSYVISVLWRVEEGAEMGIHVHPRELSSEVQRLVGKEYRSPAAFKRYLLDMRKTLGDERYQLTRNLLERKFLTRLKARSDALGGAPGALLKLVNENIAKLTAKTSCSAGYQAWQCKQYGASAAAASPAAAVVIERLVTGIP